MMSIPQNFRRVLLLCLVTLAFFSALMMGSLFAVKAHLARPIFSSILIADVVQGVPIGTITAEVIQDTGTGTITADVAQDTGTGTIMADVAQGTGTGT